MKIALSIGVLALTGLIVGLLLIAAMFYYYSTDLPDPTKLSNYEPPITTRLYAGDGRILAEYAKEDRIYVPLEAIPKRVIQSFLAAEDKNYYNHPGIDIGSIMRAAFTNLSHMGSGSLVGGSTITQQVVKNFLLTNERSLERKVKEAILAFRMSQIYTKDRILELYLNRIYLGNRSFGVGAAALNYFNKPLNELTIEEAAFLAGLPKAPSTYDPRRNYARAKGRRDYVLKELRENDFISDEEYDAAVAQPIELRERAPEEVAHADFFAEDVRRTLAAMYGDEVLYEGGLFVKTTVDPTLQDYADEGLRYALTEYDRRHGYRGPIAKLPDDADALEKMREMAATVPLYRDQQLARVQSVAAAEVTVQKTDGEAGVIPLAEMKWARKALGELSMGPAVSKASDVLAVGDVVVVETKRDDKDQIVGKELKLLQIPKVNGALVALDPNTGRVLAMAGGYSHIGSKFNRATQAKRQPGSAFKPFVYLSALENGFTPASIIVDGPISLPQGAGLPNWSPQNYSDDFLGPTTLRVGLEKSRNAMTVRLASRLGINKIIEVGKRFGIYETMPRQYAAVLGSVETTLLQLVNAYAMMVNGGKRVAPALIERIDNRYGKTIYRRDMRECENCKIADPTSDAQPPSDAPQLPDNRETVMDAATAYQMTYMLQGVVERGTAMKAKVLGVPLGGKTGTTNESRDTWFIGFSPDLVVGLYVGYDNPRSLGRRETGASVALPGFIKFMQLALKDRPSRPFPVPKGIKLYKIDRGSGQPAWPGMDGNSIYEAFKIYEQPGSGPVNTEVPTYSTQPQAQPVFPWQQNGAATQGAPVYPAPRYGAPTVQSPGHPVYPSQPGAIDNRRPVNGQPAPARPEIRTPAQRQPRYEWRSPARSNPAAPRPSGSYGTGGLY